MNPLVNKIRSFFVADSAGDGAPDGTSEAGSIPVDGGVSSKSEISNVGPETVGHKTASEIIHELKCIMHETDTSSQPKKVDREHGQRYSTTM
jgi:hypothetical protein